MGLDFFKIKISLWKIIFNIQSKRSKPFPDIIFYFIKKNSFEIPKYYANECIFIIALDIVILYTSSSAF